MFKVMTWNLENPFKPGTEGAGDSQLCRVHHRQRTEKKESQSVQSMPRMLAILAGALVLASTSHAADADWTVVQRRSDTSTFLASVGFVWAEKTRTRAGTVRMTLWATKGHRIRTTGSANCSNENNSQNISRDFAPVSYRAAGLYARPIIHTFRPTFAGAVRCVFMLSATSGPGTLRGTLEARP